MTFPRQIILAYSEVVPGADDALIRVRAWRVVASALLLAALLALVLVACASVPSNRARFNAPVADAVVYSAFGDTRQRSGGRVGHHGGIDLAAPYGTPVHAAGDGEVVFAGWGYHGSPHWGLLIAIDHGEGWTTLYAHLSEAGVEVGDRVRGGEPIGHIGTSGNATGPHVHLEVRHEGEPVDPVGHIPGLN
ncbi:murein hydrolase activator EnvC family protein [Maricaulis salignorans]|uniref:Peptidase family M23 n=1 Tax=Maricaulis salignorans TaxID=144026 RepID=A0A1G9RPL6_9PROT|nr:M23 family metallopeptidase [Maricaulis salignorans]SDM25101.1 Peptidase family M23 [Maricaulis salignorans]